MTYEELSALQYGRSKSFSEAQTDAMAVYCQAEHDLKQLQQENAKLRDEFRKMDEWHSKELTAAMAENDELRKLVRVMWLYDYAGKFSSASDDVEHVAMVYQSMRKMGVEL